VSISQQTTFSPFESDGPIRVNTRNDKRKKVLDAPTWPDPQLTHEDRRSSRDFLPGPPSGTRTPLPIQKRRAVDRNNARSKQRSCRVSEMIPAGQNGRADLYGNGPKCRCVCVRNEDVSSCGRARAPSSRVGRWGGEATRSECGIKPLPHTAADATDSSRR
jgi:hypothetical protein